MQRGQMGVFAFVRLNGRFRMHTSEVSGDRANAKGLFDDLNDRIFFGSPGYFIFVEKGRNGEDYQRAVTAFQAIKNLNN